MEKKGVDRFIEPLILFMVLFFRFLPGSAPLPEVIEFSAYAEILRIFAYNLPSLALIWYLLVKSRRLRRSDVAFSPKNDFLSAALCLPALILIGLTVFFVSRLGEVSPVQYMPPQNVISWIILIISCFSTAYLEESYFRFYLLSKRTEMGLGVYQAVFISTVLFALCHIRFYLLSKRTEMGLGVYQAVFISTVLFALCHIYAGPWAFLNAALSGTVLAFAFLRFRSLHGISFAHALYNVFVYAVG